MDFETCVKMTLRWCTDVKNQVRSLRFFKYKWPHLFVAFLYQNGADDVKKHRWFKTIDWEAVPQRKLKVRAVFGTLTVSQCK